MDLTERNGRSIRPTPAGEAFVPFAADVLGLLEQGTRASREAAQVAAKELRIAAVTTAGEYIVPPLMQAFSASHPEIALSLDVGNRERVFERVRSHRSDVAVGGRPPSEGVLGECFLENPIAIITAPDDPLAGKHALPIEELGGRPWLLREEGSGTRALNLHYLTDSGVRPATLTLGSNGAIKQAARAGLGVSLMSRAAAEVELAAGLLGELLLVDPPPARPWFVLHSAVGPLRDVVGAFVAFSVSHRPSTM